MKLDFYRYMLQIAGALLAFGIAMALALARVWQKPAKSC